LSTLDTNQSNKEVRLKKTIVVYLILSIAAIAVDNIYALFGHGVRSDSMTWMFLYPLIGGTLVFLLAELLLPTEVMHADGFRLSFNLYNFFLRRRNTFSADWFNLICSQAPSEPSQKRSHELGPKDEK